MYAQSITTLWLTIWVTNFMTWVSSTPPPPPSIYEVLESKGLPMGLLPKGVENYSLDEENGRFEVYLDHACNAEFESALHYDKNVSGQLSVGQIGNLSGISAQDLFLWFPVKGIRVDIPSSGIIYFDVGVVFKQFSLSLFETPPDCVAASHPPDLQMGPISTVDGFIKKIKGIFGYLLNLGENLREIM